MMFIEALDYSVTVEQFDTETANFFAEHPIYGTVGYPTYEDALHDMHGILGIGQFLDSVDSLIEMGLVGDHYVFNAENMITEIVNECEGWDWTPETGIVPWESSEPEPATFSKPSRQERRNNKKASRRKGSAKRFRDRSRKWQNENHVYDVYRRGLCGDYAIRGRRLAETGRPQRVNIHFTDGVPQDVYNLTEADVHKWYSVTTWDGKSMEDFFQYMDNMDWEKIPSEVRFSVDWYAENPFTADYPEYFRMDATLCKTQKTLSAKKTKEEYLNFKKKYQVYKKYAEKLHTLYKEMRAELDA